MKRASSIKVSKNFSIAFLFMMFCLNHTICNAQNPMSQKKDTCMVIRFEDFFKEDTISFEVNNIPIVHNSVLSSNTAGLTRLRIYICSIDKSNYIVNNTLDTNKIYLTNLHKKFDFKVKVNSTIEIFRVNEKKGKFVGINKSEKGKLQIDQRVISKKYD